jgi:hypothetical protein
LSYVIHRHTHTNQWNWFGVLHYHLAVSFEKVITYRVGMGGYLKIIIILRMDNEMTHFNSYHKTDLLYIFSQFHAFLTLLLLGESVALYAALKCTQVFIWPAICTVAIYCIFFSDRIFCGQIIYIVKKISTYCYYFKRCPLKKVA